jgi:heparan-alpha-glucosaminide N-acetyltransferase
VDVTLQQLALRLYLATEATQSMRSVATGIATQNVVMKLAMLSTTKSVRVSSAPTVAHPRFRNTPMSQPAASSSRLMSLDAYRGFVMICLAGNGFGIAQTAKKFPESSFWQTLGYQFEHVPWVGCAFWDLIQPSFMFMVGVAMPYSLAKRRSEGGAFAGLLGHTIVRAMVLVLLGVFLSSMSSKQTNFAFMNVLTQIGLGYFFLFLLAYWPQWARAVAAVAILAGYWAWFATHPLPPSDLNYQAVGVPGDWKFLEGFEAHWQKNANAASEVDLWLLNQFPQEKPFEFNNGGYQTLNFIPSLVTMLFGLMTGDFIRRSTNRTAVFGTLLACGLVSLGVGWAIAHFGYCPLVKRIWTPSWTLFSTGWTLILLSGFYGVIDGIGFRAWSFPLIVAGMNSILLYMLSQMLKPWTQRALERHFGSWWLTYLGEEYQPIVAACSVLLVFWLFVFWLYRQRVFLKI